MRLQAGVAPRAGDDRVLHAELAASDPALADKPHLVAASKADLAETRERLAEVRAHFAERGITLHAVSGATGEGTRELMRLVYEAVVRARAAAAEDPT